MNKFVVVVAAGALALLGGCQKQQTEAERNAEVEREVQARVTAERQAAEQQRLSEQQAELDAREKQMREKEHAADTAARERVAEPPSGQVYQAQAPSGAGESYSLFYTRLDPYGAWLETPTYGYVWQPREAIESRSWRPYTNGHWVYTDAGWTWISEEPFGWAAYHYGRWTRLRGIGWVWVPGNDWAPAWVSWRVSNDYVGWAPLPPEAQFETRVGIHNWADNYYDIGPEQYCFVPVREIGTERIERVVVPAEQNVTIVNQTTNVTNITSNNTVIVNYGPNYDALRTRSQQPIQRLRLERRTTIATENPRSVVKGEVVEVTAPVMARAQPVEHPRTVKQKVTQTVVEHGWEGVGDQKAAQQARAKMKSEATPPPNAPSKTFVKPAPVAGQPRAASPPPPAVARSTITAAPTRATASPAQTPTAPRTTRPVATATPIVAASPRATPARRALATPPALTTATPMPKPTATPPELSTSSVAPRPTFSPRALPQQFSPVPSATPAAAAPPGFGRAETKEGRRAEKQSRKQERAERKGERFQATTPTPAATATPLTSAAPAGVSPQPGKEHKKQRRPGESETSATPSP